MTDPTLALIPAHAPAGTPITAVGTGFDPGKAGVLQTSTGQRLAAWQANETGAWSILFDAPGANFTVVAVPNPDVTASAAFTLDVPLPPPVGPMEVKLESKVVNGDGSVDLVVLTGSLVKNLAINEGNAKVGDYAPVGGVAKVHIG